MVIRVSSVTLPQGVLAAFRRTTLIALAGLWACAVSYGPHVLFRHGGTYRIGVDAASPRLSPSMRLVLRSAPDAVPNTFQPISICW